MSPQRIFLTNALSLLFLFLVCQSESTKLDLPNDNHGLQPVKLHPRFPEADRLIRAIPTTVLEDNRRKLKTGFKLFQVG